MLRNCFKIFVLSFVLIFLIQSDSVQGIRLCGRRLADFLNSVCRHYGGFRAPTSKRTAFGGIGNQNSFVTKLHSFQASQGFPLEKSPEKKQFVSVSQSGIVNECCRKQCTLSTLVSYCSVGENIDEERLAEIERLLSSNSQISKEKIGKEKTGMITEQPDSARNTYTPENAPATFSSFSNLGTSSRDRPMFIVMPQLYHEINNDMSSEEYNDHSF
ncbi:ilGF domain-containing protein [Trichonephila clavata]|uniref:IlGF domain-containing protein n=2 Tax=Trichonephila clavata TaxID=2740835 RepID=A0A8X6KSB8_TRICU|nr:ilGF domain-containing protein [Trichonephila clavata]